MSLNYVRECMECGGKAIKQDLCYRCRGEKKEPFVSRAITNARADAILAITREEALERLEIAKDAIRVLGVDCPEKVWQEMRQMKALLNRVKVDKETLI
jgi:hypothetical protein